MRIILASSSPRRKELLEKIIKNFEIIPSNYDESNIKELNPKKLVKKLSYLKANEIFQKEKIGSKDLMVIGADTIVYCNKNILGKPQDEEDAKRMLKKLQNNKNTVYTGHTMIAKYENKIKVKTFLTKSVVYIKKMNDEEILDYIKTGEHMDKAGAYTVQGVFKKYIKKIKGSYNSVVGLDTEKLRSKMKLL